MKNMAIKLNATDLLWRIVQHRKWHRGKLERRAAGEIKRNLRNGTLSYKTASEILLLLGWSKVEEESWEKRNAHE